MGHIEQYSQDNNIIRTPNILTPSILRNVNCSTCTAACCRKGVAMQLSPEEAETMRLGGAELVQRDDAGQSSKFRRVVTMLRLYLPQDTYYRLETDCGYLVEDPSTGQLLCSIYGEGYRPRTCNDFKAGSFDCLFIRNEVGIDHPNVLQQYDAQTRS
jgi:hypothetical protein